MRWVIPNFISEEEAEQLVRTHPRGHNNPDTRWLFERVAEAIEQTTKDKLDLGKPSVWFIASNHRGTPIHADTGTENHQPWCVYGATLMLAQPKSGGEVFYPDIGVTVPTEEHYLSLAFHTADELHGVNPAVGVRRVFLCFFAPARAADVS